MNLKVPLNLNVDLNSVDTTIPVLPAGLYDLKIVDITQEENKDKTGFNAKIRFETMDKATSIQEKEVNPGFPLFSYYAMQPSKKENSTFDWRQNFASLQDAALGSEMGNRPPWNTDDLIGKSVRASVVVDEFEGQPTNKIKRLSHPE